MTCILYMDDVNLLFNNILAVQRAMNLTEWYGQVSGAKLNRKKSEVQLFGPWGGTDFGGLDLALKETSLKVLRVKFEKEGGR